VTEGGIVDRRIVVAVVACVVAVVALLVWRARPPAEDGATAETEAVRDDRGTRAAAGGEAGGVDPAVGSTDPIRRLPPPPIGEAAAAPDLDFRDEPFPDEEQEQAMHEAEAVLDATEPWPADADGINGAIGESLGGIRECYQQWLQLDPELAGEVVVAFVIEARGDRGAVTETEVIEATTSKNTFFEGCLLNVMSDLQFEVPDEPTTVHYPFLFSSE